MNIYKEFIVLFFLLLNSTLIAQFKTPSEIEKCIYLQESTGSVRKSRSPGFLDPICAPMGRQTSFKHYFSAAIPMTIITVPTNTTIATPEYSMLLINAAAIMIFLLPGNT